MEQADSTKLRNASEKRGAETRKKDPLELEEFLKEWRFQLRTKGTEWEEPLAVAQLQRKKMFEFLLSEEKSETKWQAEDLFGRILDEMKSYRQEAMGRLIKEHYDDLDEFLNGLIRKIQTKEENVRIAELKSLLKDLRKTVERTRKMAGWLRKNRRNRHFGVWQHRWPEMLRNNLVSGKFELDKRLQIELGKMLADYLRPEGISLETIARLILLAYWAGGLSEMIGDEIRTTYTGRELKVRNIRDNLRGIELHKAASFKKHRDEK
jgi:hypothetical protein